MSKKEKTKHVPTCRDWKTPEEGETGYCGNCGLCNGFNKRNAKCKIGNPHRNWKYNDNEPCPDWEPEPSKSYSYKDLFPSTRQKLAAFRLFRKFNGSENTHENLICFLFCYSISLDFLSFCAKSEGIDRIEEYLDATGCGITIEELSHDG